MRLGTLASVRALARDGSAGSHAPSRGQPPTWGDRSPALLLSTLTLGRCRHTRGAGFSRAARKPDTPPFETAARTRRRLLAKEQTDDRLRRSRSLRDRSPAFAGTDAEWVVVAERTCEREALDPGLRRDDGQGAVPG